MGLSIAETAKDSFTAIVIAIRREEKTVPKHSNDIILMTNSNI